MNTYHIDNIHHVWFEKDMGGGDFYIEQMYADVTSDHDMRGDFTDRAVAYVVNGFVVTGDLAAALPTNDYVAIHKFSDDGRKAEVTWKGISTVNMPDDF